MAIIKFTDVLGVSEEYKPKPASHVIPDWYKNLESYTHEKKAPDGSGSTTATIKRCMPVFDAISAGYILFSPADVYVSQRENEEGKKTAYYEWANHSLIEFHAVEQAPSHPNRNGHTVYPKWTNPWAITTPIGYSILFIQPMHRESVFTILPGIVDTDTYKASVNFPFVLNESNTFEGLIPAGTPIAQVIPFKRESWEMSIGGEAEVIETKKIGLKLRSKFFDAYKTQFRQTKEYK
jgi:hypothetical protein